MFGKLLKFEFQLHTRQVGFWVTMAVMLLMGILFVSSDEFVGALDTGEKIKSNGALALGAQAAGMSMISLFFAAVFVVSGIMRDDEHKAMELIHSTPVNTRDITYSRTLGVFLITLICLTTFMVGMFVGQFAPWVDKETLGPVNIFYFLQPLVIYLVINALLVCTILSIVAYFTRKKLLVYIAAVAVFILHTISGELINENTPDLLGALLDPFGVRPLSIDTEFWPAAEMNVKMAPLNGYLGLNRLLYGIVAILLFFGSNKLFQRGIVKSKSKKNITEDIVSFERVSLKPIPTNQGFITALKSIGARFKYEYMTTIKSIPFLILTGLAIMLAIFYILVRSQLLPVAILPISKTLAELSVVGLLFPMLIIIVFFSSEILWRERVAKFNEIIDATAVRNISLLIGKWLSLIAVLLTLFVIVNICGMIVQTTIGDVPVNVGTYAKLTFLSFAPQLLLLTILTMFIQNFVPNRILGMVISAGLIAFFIFILGNLSFAHPLMDFGRVRPGAYSEMSGFSDWTGFIWFGGLWVSLCGIFTAISLWVWPRGTQTDIKNRLMNITRNKSLANTAFAAISSIVFISLFGIMYKTLSLDENFRTQKNQERRAVAYEKLAKPLIPKEHAKIRSVEADVRFMPSKQEALVKGRYIIENTTSEPLEQLFLNPSTRHLEDVKVMSLKGAKRNTESKLSKDLDEYDVWVYKFSPPLAVGEKTELTFETFYHAPRLADGSAISKNGTFVNNNNILPTLGINEFFLQSNDTRRKYDLPKREKMPARDDMMARQSNFFDVNSDYVDFTATVCTDMDQIPIAPGKFLKEYTEDGQNCRDYKSNRPMANFFSFLTAKYTVKEDTWQNSNGENVDLKIFYHKAHDYNVDLMMDAMQSAFDVFTETYGPYQHEYLRILEFPYGNFAQSFAGTVPFSENIGFVRDPGDPEDNTSVDLATYVTMHEIGHQWFGHQLTPARVKGYNVLSEGLTENATMTAYEKKLGWQKARRVLEQRTIQRYLRSRVSDKEDEPPLAKAENQGYLSYAKASWVFWGMRQYIGDEKIQSAVRKFLQDNRFAGSPYPTTKELTDYLRQAAGPDYQQLITDYWDRITLWDLKVSKEDVKITPNTDGTFKVTFDILVDKKIASEETGKETSVKDIQGEKLDEWVEIGFYTTDPEDTLGDEWMTLERIKITKEENTISFNMKSRPSHILLDPRRLLIERNVKDNVKALPKKLASNE